jgi:N-acetylmuramic acid 6-phosphate etherase
LKKVEGVEEDNNSFNPFQPPSTPFNPLQPFTSKCQATMKPHRTGKLNSILNYLRLEPSLQSIDYVENKKQFHLYTLLTEQRHPKTWTLSSSIKESTGNGLEMLLSVDEDISNKLKNYSKDTEPLEQAVDAVCRAIKSRKTIYFYGCGSTGRLAKQMESTFWKPFWKGIKGSVLWRKLLENIPDNIEDLLIGEMTGADRALISSLEGFEDLQLIGKLQLMDRGIKKGDVVFCVTEGGETSSVIGTMMAALEQYDELNEEKIKQAKNNLYFVYNNPDHLLLPFDRSRAVIENPAITKLNITTGPQAITGSTRMQATTSETFILGIVLEEAIYRVLKEYLTDSELSEIGFDSGLNIEQRLISFRDVKRGVDDSQDSLSIFTEMESETYRNSCFSTYFARKALITVFIDSTERSPTFRLYPLDTVNESVRKSWIQVWTDSSNIKQAWSTFLGRNFRGLEESSYKESFLNGIEDPYLKDVALKSLTSAGNDQEMLYDLSFSMENIKKRGPGRGDLGVVVCIDNEVDEINNPESSVRRFCDLCREKGASVAIITVNSKENPSVGYSFNPDVGVKILLPFFPDPIGLRRQIALKMLLNAHSTGIMAKLGRIIGNTMTFVNPSNLKLIGRATYLIMSHINDTISGKHWIDHYGNCNKLTFEEVNAVLFDAIGYLGRENLQQTAEVALSIIRILEALNSRDYVSWEKAQSILENQGLETYLLQHNPNLSSTQP